ncbi:MAG: hypothetical protein JWR16_1790 [Nevskia sp.]|nr:hypothetical protein [Nevskia sp.]
MQAQRKVKRFDRRFKRTTIASVVAGLCGAPAAWAAPGDPLAAAIHVNALGTRASTPHVAHGANGSFLVIWDSPWNASCGGGDGVCAQLYSAGGVPSGSSSLVGQEELAIEDLAVGADRAGNFVVAWVTEPYRRGGVLTPPLAYIRAQRIAADGHPIGGTIEVSKETFPDLLGLVGVTKAHDVSASVAVDADGDFVVAWRTATASVRALGTYYHQFALSSSQSSIHARRYTAAGVANGSPITVESSVALLQFNSGDLSVQEPALAMDDDGDFVVAYWTDMPTTTQILAKRYDASGRAQGSRLQIASGSVGLPAVAMDAVGNFLVSWNEGASPGTNVVAQRYDKTGQPQGTKLTVETYPSPYRQPVTPVAAMAADGSFVLAWNTVVSSSSESIYPFLIGIFARPYAANGVPLAPTFTVHDDPATGEGQSEPAVSFDSLGNLVAAWTEISAYYSNDVYVQRFAGH